MLYWRFLNRPRHPFARLILTLVGAGLLVGVLVLGFFAVVAFCVIGGIVALIRALSRPAPAVSAAARPVDPRVIEGEFAVIHDNRAVRH